MHPVSSTWASKDDKKVVKVEGISEVDNRMSIINVHSNTVWHCSAIFLIILTLVICVWIYVRKGSVCCSCEPLEEAPPPKWSRRYISVPRPEAVIGLMRMEDKNQNIIKMFAVDASNKNIKQHPTLSTLLQPMREMH